MGLLRALKNDAPAAPDLLAFRPCPRMTLGVELELQIVDRNTRNLVPDGSVRLFNWLGGERLHIKHELFQSMLEIDTGICNDVAEARADLAAQLATLAPACDALGLDLAGGGTHPFARWSDRLVFPNPRYSELIERNQWISRRHVIFGLHVHVGMRNGQHATAMLNGMLRYAPYLLALSASSPFWQGNDTGLASSRVTLFEALPTAGTPCTYETWDEFKTLFGRMRSSGAIRTLKDLWWDIRPHPDFGTVELRICDMPASLGEAMMLVALVQCLYRMIDDDLGRKPRLPPPPAWLMRENKWRAARFGVEAELIVDENGATTPLRDGLAKLMRRLEPIARELRCADELASIEQVIASPGAHRQRQALREHGKLEAVVEGLVDELRSDVPPPEPLTAAVR